MNKWQWRFAAPAVSGALLLGGCASQQAPEAMPAEEEPAAVAEPAQEPGLLAMPWAEFNALPAEMKRSYALDHLLGNETIHQVRVADDEGAAKLSYPLTGEGELVDLDGQSIVNNWDYALDDARMSGETGVLLEDEAIKLLSAAFYETDDSAAVLDEYMNERDRIVSRDAPFYVSDTAYVVYTETPVAEGTDSAGNPIKFKDISFTDQYGVNKTGRFAHVPVDALDADGFTSEFWLLVNLQPAP